MSRVVKKLTDLDIDEVSLVDRAANQHSTIAFSKAYAAGDSATLEDSMGEDIFDEDGSAVSVDVLEHGDVVYDDEGNEFVFVEDDVEDDEDDTVGKSRRLPAVIGDWERAQRAAIKRAAMKKKLLIGAGATAGVGAAAGGAEYGRRKFGKSLGDSVLEQLSKAVTDDDREQIIAKAMGEVDIAKAEAAQALAWAESEHDARVTGEFISKAAEYNLPVAPGVLGPILKAMTEVLDDEQLQVVDDLFNSIGDALYEEIGYVGDSDNVSVLDQVDAYAGELVGKSNASREQAMTALLETNPALYDAYVSESR